MADRRGLVDDEAAGWADLQAAFAQVPDEGSDTPVPSLRCRSPTEVVLHVAEWLEACADALRAIGAGRPAAARPTVAGPSTGGSKDAALARCARARDLALRAFLDLPEGSRDAWAWFDESGPRHYADHGAELRAWLGQVSDRRSIEP